jgi:hypothetical protein
MIAAACAGLRSGVCGKVISHTSAMAATPKSPLRAAMAIRIVRPFRRTVAKLYGLNVKTEGYLIVNSSHAQIDPLPAGAAHWTSGGPPWVVKTEPYRNPPRLSCSESGPGARCKIDHKIGCRLRRPDLQSNQRQSRRRRGKNRGGVSDVSVRLARAYRHGNRRERLPFGSSALLSSRAVLNRNRRLVQVERPLYQGAVVCGVRSFCFRAISRYRA